MSAVTGPAGPAAPTAAAPPETAGERRNGGGVNPLVVVAVAFAVGLVLARILDWRGHAHPRD